MTNWWKRWFSRIHHLWILVILFPSLARITLKRWLMSMLGRFWFAGKHRTMKKWLKFIMKFCNCIELFISERRFHLWKGKYKLTIWAKSSRNFSESITSPMINTYKQIGDHLISVSLRIWWIGETQTLTHRTLAIVLSSNLWTFFIVLRLFSDCLLFLLEVQQVSLKSYTSTLQ